MRTFLILVLCLLSLTLRAATGIISSNLPVAIPVLSGDFVMALQGGSNTLFRLTAVPVVGTNVIGSVAGWLGSNNVVIIIVGATNNPAGSILTSNLMASLVSLQGTNDATLDAGTNRIKFLSAAVLVPTNTAPTSVTVGTTPPDIWYAFADTNGYSFYVPGWTNH